MGRREHCHWYAHAESSELRGASRLSCSYLVLVLTEYGFVAHSGICERPAGVQYEVFVRDSHMMHQADGSASGGH